MKQVKELGTWRWVLAVSVVSLCYGSLRISCCREALPGWASLQSLYAEVPAIFLTPVR